MMPTAPPPNVLLILSDEHRPDFGGCLGRPEVLTPNLDRLAARGCRFSDAMCPDPVCGPSRRSLMTGRWVHQIRAWTNRAPFTQHDETWAATLRDAGYETCLIGKMDLAGQRQDGGFGEHHVRFPRPAEPVWPRQEPWASRLDRPSGRPLWQLSQAGVFGDGRAPQEGVADQVGTPDRGHHDHDRWATDAAIEWLNQPHDGPWCLCVGLLMPHWPYRASPEWYAHYENQPPLDLPQQRFPNPDLHPSLRRMQRNMGIDATDADDRLRAQRAYCGMVSALDGMIGDLMSALKAQGQLQNTIVIYTSDHGESLGDRGLFFKHSPYRESLGVPLVVAGPGVPAGSQVTAPVSLVDLHATILGRFGLPADPDRPARDLWPLIRGEASDRGPVFAEHHHAWTTGGWFGIVDQRWKYIHYPGEAPSLFDRLNDPLELTDLGTDPDYERVRQACWAELQEVCDTEAVAERCRLDLGLPRVNDAVAG